MTKREVYLEVKRLVERGWTTGAYARNARGDEVDACSKDAESFCLSGAMIRTCQEDWPDVAEQFSEDASLHKTRLVWLFNDSSTKEEVLAALDRAIERAS